MNQKHSAVTILFIFPILLFSLGGVPTSGNNLNVAASANASFSADEIDALPNQGVLFIENVGQFNENARYQGYGSDRTIWLAEDALWITILETAQPPAALATGDELSVGTRHAREIKDIKPRKGTQLKLSFVGANPHPRIEPYHRLEAHVSYFIGNDPDAWRPEVPVWGGVRYVDLYPGIDLEVSGEGGQIVQRLIARPGANLDGVRLHVEGADRLALEGDHLRLETAVGEYRMALLQVSGVEIGNHFSPTVDDDQVVSPFSLPQIEEVNVVGLSGVSDLLYATFLGGNYGDYAYSIAVDSGSAAYIAGETCSTNFPATPGAFDTGYNGGYCDAFVVKLNRTASALDYATFLGGSDDDYGYGIAVDSDGAAYITGYTSSTDFPTAAGAFDTGHNGNSDAFVVKLNGAGSALNYATYLGGSDDDYGYGIAVDPDGAAYITGETWAANFPTTVGAFDTGYNGSADAFVVKLNSAGSALNYATFLGGSGGEYVYSVAVDSSDAAYIAGETSSTNLPTTAGAVDTTHNGLSDVFVVKLNSAGSTLGYATFLGGSDDDYAYSIAVDADGAAHITGGTCSTDFPTTPGAFDTGFNVGYCDAFAVKLNGAASALDYATFLGGSEDDFGYGIAVDSSGVAYITGHTYSTDFPTTAEAFDTGHNGSSDAFVVRFNGAGSALDYATFLGGSDDDFSYGIAIDPDGAAFITGYTSSTNIPTTAGAFDTGFNGSADAFVAKINVSGIQIYSISGRVVDSNSNPISGVRITIDPWHSAVTDSQGAYTIKNLSAGTYTATPSLFAYSFSPSSRTIVVLAENVNEVDFLGTLPRTGFKSDPDGYGFDNYGRINLEDYTISDLRRMFGDEAVCWMAGPKCDPKPAASIWNLTANRFMEGGHSYGMAVTSLRFFNTTDTHPDDVSVYKLDPSSKTLISWGGETFASTARRNIAFFFASQFPEPVRSTIKQALSYTPNEVLAQLANAMSGSTPDPMILILIFGGSGHAVTPYAISNPAPGIYWVWVYDNNHPGDADRYVIFNQNTNNWNYDLGWETWSGTADSHSIAGVSNSIHNQTSQTMRCPWCPSSLVNAATSHSLSLAGDGHLLITDSHGRRLGFIGDEYIEEIPQGYGLVPMLGTGVESEPIYTLPLTETYSILLDGQTVTQTGSAALAQFGPGYAVSMNDLTISSTTRDQLSISNDGRQIIYHANQEQEPTLSLAVDSPSSSYRFVIGGLDIAASRTIGLSANTSVGKLTLNGSQSAGGIHNLYIERVNSSGFSIFSSSGITILPGDTHIYVFGTWDGNGAITLQIDHGSNGSIDETKQIPNQMKNILFLPLINIP